MSVTDNKACCSSGNPSAGDYPGKGHEVKLPESGLRAYISATPNKDKAHIKRGLVVIYDIFGLDIGNTRAFVDRLVEPADTEMVAIMPDIFHGKPWSLKNFPPQDFKDLINWVQKEGSWKQVEPLVVESMAYLRKEYPNLKSHFGSMGFCYGGQQALYCCTRNDFSGAVSLHGSFITPELVESLRAPVMLLHTTEDPSLDPLKKILDKKPFGKDCYYHVYDQVHGFTAARGDWSQEKVKKDVDDALAHARAHLVKHI